MHTFTHDNGKTRVNISYNSDMSGDCLILMKENNTNDNDWESFRIPGDILLKFVAEYVRQQKISKLENMNYMDILMKEV